VNYDPKDDLTTDESREVVIGQYVNLVLFVVPAVLAIIAYVVWR
jgi:hypothetical protein